MTFVVWREGSIRALFRDGVGPTRSGKATSRMIRPVRIRDKVGGKTWTRPPGFANERQKCRQLLARKAAR